MKLKMCLLTEEVASISPDESSPHSLPAAVNLLQNKVTQANPKPSELLLRVLQPEQLPTEHWIEEIQKDRKMCELFHSLNVVKATAQQCLHSWQDTAASLIFVI